MLTIYSDSDNAEVLNASGDLLHAVFYSKTGVFSLVWTKTSSTQNQSRQINIAHNALLEIRVVTSRTSALEREECLLFFDQLNVVMIG